MENAINQAAKIIKNGKILVMLTGAGVSTESGIPDFRGASGSRTHPERAKKILEPLRKKVLQIKYPIGIKSHPYFELLFSHETLLFVKPNPTHYAITKLENMGKLSFLVSQNVDNLHLQSGFPEDKLFEIHGNCFKLICKKCNIFYDALAIREMVLKNIDYVPLCKKCGGKLSSSVINFGDVIPERGLKIAIKISRMCDVFIAAGSTLEVTPAASLFDYAKDNNAKTIIINLGKTPKDKYADILIKGKTGYVMTEIIKKIDSV